MALSPAYRGRFLLCDFLGTATRSGIVAFDVVPDGAGYALGETERPLWGVLATDCAFGPDGALYVTDWVEGWPKPGKGRIYRLSSPDDENSTALRETAATLARGMAGRRLEDLQAYLAHGDRRVRLAAQLELVARGPEGHQRLLDAAWAGSGLVRRGNAPAVAWPASSATTPDNALLARLHGIWGLGIAARRDPAVLDVILELTDDPEPEVRAQVLHVIGEARAQGALPQVLERLADDAPRVRAFAALAAGRLGDNAAAEGLIALSREAAASGDPVLRHAAIMGLDGCANAGRFAMIDALTRTPEEKALAMVLLRRRRDPRLADHLTDDSPLVVAEAARAIHDVPVPEALPALAALLQRPGVLEPLVLRRALSAAFRVGNEADARSLAAFATRVEQSPEARAEALDLLAQWTEPTPRDTVTGSWRPLPPRTAPWRADLAVSLLEQGIDEAPEEVVLAWIGLLAAADAHGADERLAAWVGERGAPGDVRVAALRSVAPEVQQSLLSAALEDPDPELRATALEVLVELDPEAAVPRLPGLLEAGSLPEQRAALQILGALEGPEADELLTLELRKLLAGLVPAEVALDLLLAAEGRDDRELVNSAHAHPGPARHRPPAGALAGRPLRRGRRGGRAGLRAGRAVV